MEQKVELPAGTAAHTLPGIGTDTPSNIILKKGDPKATQRLSGDPSKDSETFVLEFAEGHGEQGLTPEFIPARRIPITL